MYSGECVGKLKEMWKRSVKGFLMEMNVNLIEARRMIHNRSEWRGMTRYLSEGSWPCCEALEWIFRSTSFSSTLLFIFLAWYAPDTHLLDNEGVVKEIIIIYLNQQGLGVIEVLKHDRTSHLDQLHSVEKMLLQSLNDPQSETSPFNQVRFYIQVFKAINYLNISYLNFYSSKIYINCSYFLGYSVIKNS